VAFPGGRADAGETPAQTALRESWEEVGLDRRFVRPLGLGDAYVTGTGFSITPVVGLIRPGFELTPFDAEVAEIFELPFAFLMDAANHQLRSMTASDGVERRFYAMELGARTVWAGVSPASARPPGNATCPEWRRSVSARRVRRTLIPPSREIRPTRTAAEASERESGWPPGFRSKSECAALSSARQLSRDRRRAAM
jgi:ADP-ribose pyrophosphatase YjhB (NUDIX family)